VKGAAKISKVMGEFKRGELHSGSKKGPKVTNPKQAKAIAMSEARAAGAKIPAKKKGVPVGKPRADDQTSGRRPSQAVLVNARRGMACPAALRPV
jgi:hypothetical protein